MRVDPDLVYDDYKDRVEAAFHLLEKKICETVDDVTNYMADEDDDLLIEDSTSLAIWIITIGEYEVRHDILEKRVHNELCEVHPAEDDDEEQLLSKVRKYPISKS